MSVFVGRVGELEMLAEVAHTASASGAAAAVVVGEPGSGKSRLLAEARGRAALEHSFSVVGYEPERNVPLAAAAPLLRTLTETSRDGRLLDGLLFRPDDASALEPVRVFETAHRALRQLQPALLVIDDLQWMDELSYALCHYLLRAARDSRQRLAAFAATRPHEKGAELAQALSADRVTVVELSALSREESVELARALDPSLDRTRAAQMYEQAQGSPFWLEEVVRGGGGVDDPARFLIGRLRAAAADTVTLLGLLAVTGRPVDVAEAAASLDWPAEQVDAALGDLVARGIAVRPGATVRLTHDLIREGALAGLPADTRRELHRRLAERLELEAGHDVRRLREALEHRQAAGLPTVGLALRLVHAPHRTLLGREGANQLAAAADEADPNDPRVLELNEQVAALAGDVGNHALALERWSLLADRTSDRLVRARLLLEASRAAWGMEELVAARSLLDEARMVPHSDASLSIALDAHETALLLWGERRLVEGRELASRTAGRARERARAVGGVDNLEVEARRAYCDSLRSEYWAAMQLERRDELLRSAEEAIDASRGVDERLHLESVLDTAFALLITDRPQEAEARARFAWRESRRLVLPAVTVRAGLSLAEALVELGRLDDAEATASQALELSSRVDDILHLTPRPRRVLDDIALHRHDWREALRPYERFADEEASQHEAIKYHALVAWWLARLGGDAEERDTVARVACAREAAEATSCLRCFADMRLIAADALARIGRAAEARSLLSEWDATHAGASFRRRRIGASVAARSGDPEGRELLESALDEAAGRGLALEEVWIRLDLADALLVEDRPRAIEELRAAADRAAELGSRTQRELAEQSLRSLGVRTWRRGVAGAPLTAREEEVARLVSGGATNREIAQTLFLSEKTIERHVSNAFKKLGVRNRAELASHVRDREAEHAGNPR